MNKFEFDCVYGSGNTRDTAYFYNGWYCVHGSINVNYTEDYIDPDDVTDVELLSDLDTFTWSSPIKSLKDLKDAVEQ